MQQAKTINVSAEPLKPRAESWDLVTKWIVLLAAHFRVEMSEAEIRIYCVSLESKDAECLSKAMQRCLSECEFMPKLKDIHDRMPEPNKYVKDDFVPISESFEPNPENPNYHYHVWTDANGNRRVKIEALN
jgi:hypothetical protein